MMVNWNQVLWNRIFVVLVFVVSSTLSACKHTDEVLAQDPALLWKIANEAYEGEDWAVAQIRFNKFKQFYGDDPRVPIARYRLADSAFQERKFANAEVYYKDFIERHPQSELISKARLMLAESQFMQVPYFISRDISMAEKAIKSYEQVLPLIQHDPKQTSLARQRIQELETKLFIKQYDIGYWYYWKGGYAAAVNRFDVLLSSYRHLQGTLPSYFQKSGHILVVSAIQLADEASVKKARTLLTSFTNTKAWQKDIQKLDNWLSSHEQSYE